MEQIHTLCWSTIDSWKDNRGFVVQAFGRCMDDHKYGQYVQIQMEGYRPYIRLKIGKTVSRHEFDVFFEKFTMEARGVDPKITFEGKFSLYPYSEFYDRFVKITFNGDYSKKKGSEIIRLWIKEKKYDIILPSMQLYDAALPTLLAFQHELNIVPTGHIQFLSCDVAIDQYGIWHIHYTKVQNVQDDRIAPFKIMSFDIETLSYESFKTGNSIFPDPHNPNDTVSVIGSCVVTFGSALVERHVFLLDSDKSFFSSNDHELEIHDEENDAAFIIYPFFSEKELLLGWSRFVSIMNPDILTGYNIFNFDFDYIHVRVQRYGIGVENEFNSNLSRTDRFDRMFQVRKLSSNAYGDNTMKFYDIPGRLNFDLYLHMKKDYKLDSYKLDNVADHFLNRKKLDMTPRRLFQALKESRESMIEVSRYCIRDCDLVNELVSFLQIFFSIMELSNVSRIPFDFINMRGQQIRSFSLISYAAMHNNFAVPDAIARTNENGSDKFQGAFVLDPKKEKYMNEPVVVLDFNSLYPSLIIGFNLCYSTTVMDDCQLNSDDINEISVVDDNSRLPYKFVKKNIKEGLVSKILENLWVQRKNVKKQMKDCTGTLHSILNARQLSYKVTMNSIYGFFGVSRDFAMLPCKHIAECITALGRQHITKSKAQIEQWYPTVTTIYADTDSLYLYFPESYNNIEKAFEIGHEAERKINETFISPIAMELERVYLPLIMLTKKRYCAVGYEDPNNLSKHKIDVKGMSLIRRDACPFTKMVLEKALNIVFFERDITKAYLYLQNQVKDLIEGRIDNKLLIMTKTLSSKHSESTDAINSILPHVSLAAKMKLRDPNNFPQSGDRVPFLITINGHTLLKDKVEDPVFVEENSLSVDLLYYLEHHVKVPCEEIFNVLLAPKLFDIMDPSVKSDVKALKQFREKQKLQSATAALKRSGQQQITIFYSKEMREDMNRKRKKEDADETKNS